MNICLFSPEEIGRPLAANDERAVHIIKILHKGVGDSFSAGVIGGQAGTATITKIDGADFSQAQDAGAETASTPKKGGGAIHFTFTPQSDGKPLFPLHMIIGFPRPIQLKRLLRDMAALGVSSVRLCGTELGEKSYLKASLSDPAEVYKMLLDGTVQAASAHVPEPFVYPTLAACLDALASEAAQSASPVIVGLDPTIRSPLLLALDNVKPAQSLSAFLQANPPAGRPVFAAIGSERGWSPAERALLEERGFVRLGMGSRVMRTETACTVSASLILSEMGALG
ncbi:MAG: RsmE family RNA methyltransferase [Treponema sp.]|nr:RsmE family RNA methyltransferase [Treponema sp.]